MIAAAVSLPGQLAARHLGEFPGRAPLLVDCPDPGLAEALNTRNGATPALTIQRDRALWKDFRDAGLAAAFSASLEPPEPRRDGALVFLPKGRELTAMTLEQVAGALDPGATVWLVGANTAGIRSADADLERWIGPVTRTETARHCALLEARHTVAAAPLRQLANHAVRFPIKAPGRDLTAVSLPGVFSHGSVDDGTRLLLSTLTPGLTGRILDFGCGCGIVGAVIQSSSPEAVLTHLDASALALEATRMTLAANTLPVDRVIASDGLDEAEGPFEFIVSNPPFHTGTETDRGIAERFVKAAPGSLARGGRLRVVANTFLRYRPLMEEAFKAVRVVAADDRYQVLEARKK